MFARLAKLPVARTTSRLVRWSSNVRLTSESYPQVHRLDFGQVTPKTVDFFKSVVGDSAVITNEDDLLLYNEDQMRKYRGQSRVCVKPKNTQQVSEIVKYCNENKLALVPQGGNTGLVGGSVPVFDEIVLSLSSMDKVRSFDSTSGILKADAGLILENADNFLAENGYIFPLDLGAKGSCHIGGNVAANAGGLRLLRYGSLHGSVLGLEVVLPDGTIYDSMNALRKDNTGYDLKQLFIGSEGTLGVITGVSILCPSRPKAVNIAFLGLESYDAVQETFKRAKSELCEILSAFEFMDRQSQVQNKRFSKNTHPLAQDDPDVDVPEYPFYVLIETSGSSKEHDDAKLETFLESIMEEGIVSDGVVSQDETQLKALWNWREGISEASNMDGGVYKYDVSLPLPVMYDLIEVLRVRLDEHGLRSASDASKPVVDVVGYGHIGDGNLHVNVIVREYSKTVEKCLEPFVYQWVSDHHGSISAEHGLGFQKKNYVGYSKTDVEIALMKQIKHKFDPQGIMNPYNIIRPDPELELSEEYISSSGEANGSRFDLRASSYARSSTAVSSALSPRFLKMRKKIRPMIIEAPTAPPTAPPMMAPLFEDDFEFELPLEADADAEAEAIGVDCVT
ncbi:hypothetical protein OGAPHI_002438 [Ogataea philodendri]|uniref:D-2-hydroxyglutarate dehydrogenase, mitochondrial n=1 Tax=Ogataea philodendri TaxID=1378263 RepID=A0A9P8PCE8_9ASCO|nr:uncharacterized protein OGAPHI_002438 [Ogataea philodendri]KAH3668684.1 hypothetical protein OGAPHI_002438 [Ogataea philodendri]